MLSMPLISSRTHFAQRGKKNQDLKFITGEGPVAGGFQVRTPGWGRVEAKGGAAILEQGWVNVQRGKVRSHDSNTFGGRGECIARAPRRNARTPRGLHAETTQGPAWSTQTQRRAWVSVLRQGGLCVPLVVSRARRGCARQHPCSLATAKAPWPDLGGWEGSP